MRPRIYGLLLVSSTALALSTATGTATAAAGWGEVEDANAPAFDVPWHTVDDGGGRTSGGGFAAVVTIGQPEPPGKLIGGGFTLRGGFWPRLAADSPAIFADGFESGTVNAWSSSTP